MKKYKHLVFDIDGTLLDTADINMYSLQKTVQELRGVTMPLEELHFSFGIPGRRTMELLGFADPQAALTAWIRNYAAYTEKLGIRPFAGIPETLRAAFESGAFMGVITSKIREEYDRDFAPKELGGFISCAITASDTPKGKPSPDPMLEYRKRTGAKAEEILYFGDSVYDMECAAAAGVDHALVLWGCLKPEGIAATYRLKKPEEILNFVEI